MSIIFQWRDILQNVAARRGEQCWSLALIPLIFVYVIWNHLSPRFRINFSEIQAGQQNSPGAGGWRWTRREVCVKLSSRLLLSISDRSLFPDTVHHHPGFYICIGLHSAMLERFPTNPRTAWPPLPSTWLASSDSASSSPAGVSMGQNFCYLG